MSRAIYIFSEQMEAMANELIEKVPEFAYIKEAAPSIAFLESDQKKRKDGGLVYGDCERVKPKMREFMDYDYVITFYNENIQHMNVQQLQILMMHELYHIDCVREADGTLTCAIRPHDIQEFHFISDQFGIEWAEEA